jgi:uncharacterized protein YecA (UPF0149 family)
MRRLRIAVSRQLMTAIRQAQAQPERGDVPGWVLVVAMTVALVLLVWGIAGPELERIITEAMNDVRF